MDGTITNPRRRRAVALLGAASVLAAASFAQAAPADAAWSEQFYLSYGDAHRVGGDGHQQQLAMDADGDSLAVWTMSDFTGDGGEVGIQARSIPSGGFAGPPLLISPNRFEGSEPAVDMTPSGDAVIAWTGIHAGAVNAQIGIRRLDSSGQLGAVQTISGVAQTAQTPRVAVDGAGGAVVAWRRSDGVHQRIQARVIGADGTRGPVRTLSAAAQNATGLDVEVDDAGNGVVAWRRSDGTNTRIEARTVSTSGAVGALKLLSEAGRSAASPVAAPLPGAGARIAWLRLDAAANFRVQTRTISNAGALGPVRTLSPTGDNVMDLHVDTSDNGDAVVAWGYASALQARTVTPADAVGALQRLSATGETGFSPHVSVDADGDAVAVWENGQSGRVETRTMTSAGLWGPASLVSDPLQPVTRPQVKIDDAGVDAAAVWSRTSPDGAGDLRVAGAVGL